MLPLVDLRDLKIQKAITSSKNTTYVHISDMVVNKVRQVCRGILIQQHGYPGWTIDTHQKYEKRKGNRKSGLWCCLE